MKVLGGHSRTPPAPNPPHLPFSPHTPFSPSLGSPQLIPAQELPRITGQETGGVQK